MKIYTNNPSLITKETCNHCAYEKKRNNITISVNLLTKSLDFLNVALSSILQKQSKTCEVYKIYNIEYTYKLGIHLFIEPYFAITKQQKAT
jgi:hypothetical protein